jgi:hypothetical protein
MATKSTRQGVTAMMALGVKELPRNASWLLAKALNPIGEAAGEASAAVRSDHGPGNGLGRSLAETVRSAGATLKEALPTPGGSVEMRLERARTATEEAREAEEHALRSAEWARQKVEEVKQVDREEQARIDALRKEHDREVEQRVAEARRAADAQVEAARAAAQRDADKQLAKEYEAAERRIAVVREEANAAKEQAERDLVAATEQLAEARRLADEATAAAQAAAEDARQEADRLSARAKSGARDRDDVVAEAEKLQRATGSTAPTRARRSPSTGGRSSRSSSSSSRSASTRSSSSRSSSNRSSSRRSSGSRPRRGADLTNRSKQELVELARKRGVEGRSEMSKAQLVKALRARNGR